METTKFIHDYPTYATIEEADKYLAMKFGSTWSEKDDLTKGQLLITATRKIDEKRYIGRKVDEEQPLQFPRIFRDGSVSNDTLLMSITIEIADMLNSQRITGMDTTTANELKATANMLDSYQIGDTKLTFKDEIEDSIGGLIRDLLKPYLSDKGMEIWL